MKVYEAVARAISDATDSPIFGLMGDGNMDLMVEFAERHRRTLVHARHEQNAVAMADGYARFSGRPGLGSVTQGPGLTNTATSLTVARHHRSPVLLLAGQTSLGDMHNPQRLDQGAFTTATAGAGVVIENEKMVAPALDAVFRHLHAGLGPFVLNLPYNVQTTDLSDDWSYARPSAPMASEPEEAAVDRAADLLLQAERPAILAGRGAVLAGADAVIGELATALGAPIASSLVAKGICSDHPFAVWVSGGLGQGIAEEALSDCDILLAVGASLNQWTTNHGELVRNRKIIQIDADPTAFGAYASPTLALLGDARLTTQRLCGAVRRRGGKAHAQPRLPGLSRRQDYADAENGHVDPRRALDVLQDVLPPDRIIVADGGHSAQAICQKLTVRNPRDWAYSFDFACIGQGLGLAIGACFARPGQRVTLVTGDGSLMMNMADLDTAVRYDLPLTIIILNDEGFGQERHTLGHKGLPERHARYASPDFAKLAESLGGRGRRLEGRPGLNELRSWVRDDEHSGGLIMLDIPINGAVELPVSQELVRHIH
ncbi:MULTISPECIES: thiamine pyrophosphate-binding protein [unclassified Mesorhizobium]|uniref:thiamine pyrophosphate-binding protein n=1 Tax=unclassified Mesorhizobium TaxID=325217 RepID=UPI001CCBDA56|nr:MULTISPECIES: thiamine pyrophosphate-binding protein [unclassified Mesorhizobium]MBZ9845938.1 thiamine pyrophosphate-binding protein [Mesorhizobium sp. CA5]MBZ9861968.1 thiamine pyrophosphate-binding protein [Mesorhizobium sp. CA12]